MEFIGKTCPVCSNKFSDGDDVVVCPKCGALYHRKCYDEKGKCIFPDLHKEGKTWKDPEEIEKEKLISEEKEKAEEKEYIVCAVCGCKNSSNLIFCRRCGIELHMENYVKIPDFLKPDDDDDEEEDFEEEKQNENPNIIFGYKNISSEEPITLETQFDGASGEELCRFVGSNIHYYIPVFTKINMLNSCRFNFAAFFFGGLWYLYRKMYRKGIIISIITMAMTAVMMITSELYGIPIFEKAQAALKSQAGTVTSSDYVSWIINNESTAVAVLTMMPYIINIALFVMMIIIGATANRSYYKKAVSEVSKIKNNSKFSDDKNSRILEIAKKGGVSYKAVYFYGIAFILINSIADYITAILK